MNLGASTPECGSATPASLLAHGRALGLTELDAGMLVLHAVGRVPQDRAWLRAHDDEPLAPHAATGARHLMARRRDGWPMAYLIGCREFYGLTLTITPDVLDPRPDTEILVDWAREGLADRPARVLDLGTGSGAIILALKHTCPLIDAHGSERSPQALTVARLNAERLGLDITWHAGTAQGDWTGPVQGTGPFDLVVANPPYLAADDPHLPDLVHEPRWALVAGQDGLADLFAIAQQARMALAAGGRLLLEHGWRQGPPVRDQLQTLGYRAIETRRDLAGHERCTGAIWDNRTHPGRA